MSCCPWFCPAQRLAPLRNPHHCCSFSCTVTGPLRQPFGASRQPAGVQGPEGVRVHPHPVLTLRLHRDLGNSHLLVTAVTVPAGAVGT